MEKTMVLDAEFKFIDTLYEEDFDLDMESEKAQNYRQQALKVWQRMYVTDFYNVDDVIDFLSKLQPFTENRFVNNLPYHHLLQVLHQHGYEKDAFTGVEFDANDRHKFAHYLVGQAIAGFHSYFGGINCTFVAHAKDYKAKFQIH